MANVARHAEIARRYDRKRDVEPVSIAALRISQLRRLFFYRYGHQLPDDDAGKDDAFVMAHALAWRPKPAQVITAWLSLNAPWMGHDDRQVFIAKVLAKPIRWRADTLAKRLNLTEADRSRLKITTIGAVDVDKAERLARRNERKRLREQARRSAAGAKTRAEYEGQSITRTKPWETLGMSRRTWYRLGKPTAGTSPCPA